MAKRRATAMQIENTTTTMFGGGGHVLMALPGVIEASERQGQAQIVASTQLPAKTQDPREAFEAFGFKFGKLTPGDPMFLSATLPDGWEKRGSDHAMWSYIHDEKGRRRVAVFYKAAFYDREAFMRLTPRYCVRTEWLAQWTSFYVTVLDGETEIHRTATFTGEERSGYEAEERFRKEAVEWLAANRPGWDDPVKSWDLA